MADILKEKGKEILLGALLLGIAVVVWRRLGTEPDTGATSGRHGASARTADIGALKVFPVDWAALGAARPTYDPNGRNIFQFGVLPVPTPPPLTDAEKAAIKAAQEAAARQAAEQAAAQAQAQAAAQVQAQQLAQQQANLPPPPPPRPQPPPINYKFIGYIGPPEHKIGVLHDGTDLIFVRQGEVLGKDFRILEIGYESIKFGYTDPQFKGDTQTLPMSSSY
ncbi:MAG TPA: hypothetical protein VJ144_03165 [Candidatus Polarisedimenticolia bacterium]|nr:hypothetical protein [Candidatus Polarisedimenticolia bacterium]